MYSTYISIIDVKHMNFFGRCNAFYACSIPKRKNRKIARDKWLRLKHIITTVISTVLVVKGALVSRTSKTYFVGWGGMWWVRWGRRRSEGNGWSRLGDIFPWIPMNIESMDSPVTYQLLSTNKAAHKSPFLAVYDPGNGGLVLSSLWRSSISFSSWPPKERGVCGDIWFYLLLGTSDGFHLIKYTSWTV